MTAEELSHYRERGYVVRRALFSEDELQVWLDRLGALIRGEAPKSDGMLIMRDVMIAKAAVEAASPEAAVAKIQDFDRDPVLRTYTDHPKLLAEIAALTGENIVSIHNMLINKPPGVDGRHPLHPDLLYFPFRPADEIVATWTALDRASRENGCLVVVPGSHKGELLEHENPDWEHLNSFYFGAKGEGQATERIHLEMEPGDTVFFHPLLLHGSGRNRSRGFRAAISCHFASAGCRFLPGHAPIPDSGFRPYILVRGREHEGCI